MSKIGTATIELAADFSRFAQSLRTMAATLTIVFAERTGNRTRIRCTCGATPHANEWRLHMTSSRLRRHPWRATREHRPA